jgi:hypothetical protein
VVVVVVVVGLAEVVEAVVVLEVMVVEWDLGKKG